VSPDGRRVVTPLPVLSSTAWALQVMDVAGGPLTEIVSGGGHPIMPAWGADGRIYFSRADDRGVFGLWRVAAAGGVAQAIVPASWDWKAPTARLSVRPRVTDANGGAPRAIGARVKVLDGAGHPAFPTGHQVWFDSQNGALFAYADAERPIEFEMPVGEYRAEATHGFEYLPATATGRLLASSGGAGASGGVSTNAGVGTGAVAAGAVAVVETPLDLRPVGGPSFETWYSGDHHFHLNYGGQVLLAPDALVAMLRGEDLDVATPLSANLHTRRIDEGYFAWTRQELPFIQFGQEVRSHFLGHTGHVGVKQLYWPWYWGPGYPVYGLDDRSNHEALRQTRAQGGVNAYVHPVTGRTPFGGPAPAGIPLELVSDAVLGDVDTIELACLWSDELGTADVWYRLLNVGARITPSAGTDAMVDFFRTMAIGTTRVYVDVPAPVTLERYLAGLKEGRSFVSTGPLLQFKAADAGPGAIVRSSAGQEVPWTLTVASALPFERVEVLVNGEVVWNEAGLAAPGTKTWRGKVKAPAGGWIAARVRGGETVWPAMDSYPFAHSAPTWFGAAGSTDPAAAARAAKDLLAALDVAEARVRQAYKEVSTPTLLGRLDAARKKLQTLVAEPTRIGRD
jgi:TolB protein